MAEEAQNSVFTRIHDEIEQSIPKNQFVKIAEGIDQERRNCMLLDRSLGILHRMATERVGWRRFFSRWYFSDEPLRNDAARLIREAQFQMPRPMGTRLVGDDD